MKWRWSLRRGRPRLMLSHSAGLQSIKTTTRLLPLSPESERSFTKPIERVRYRHRYQLISLFELLALLLICVFVTFVDQSQCTAEPCSNIFDYRIRARNKIKSSCSLKKNTVAASKWIRRIQWKNLHYNLIYPKDIGRIYLGLLNSSFSFPIPHSSIYLVNGSLQNALWDRL